MGVVMDYANPNHASALIQIETLNHFDGVIMPIPDKNAGVAQDFGDGFCFDAIFGEGDGWYALVELFLIGDAIDAHAGDSL